MANDFMEDEVFDFSNIEFTREDLISALHEMVDEYRKLSQTFEEVKAENKSLKNSSGEPSVSQLGESDSLKTELSKLKTEIESLRMKSEELTFENGQLNYLISGKMNHESKNGFEYVRPENKPSWLRNRIVKVKADFETSVPKQQRHGSVKVKSGWKKAYSQRNLNGQSAKSNHNRFHNVYARTLVDTHTRRTVKGQFQESEGHNDDRRSAPSRTRSSRDEEEEVEVLPTPVERMDVVIARFQRMNPQVFIGDESSEDTDSWLRNITGLFGRVQYDDELRLSLVTLQLRKGAERWWRGASSTLLETRVGITLDSFCETFRQEYVPEFYVNAREREFDHLKQGTMSGPRDNHTRIEHN
ncbi:hypothetical protein F511_12094 [Dorcoceras hygrometricum]|uniref:Retrotransposon gag domain-containing protein n=1 Tax=Dorcoceras hygrometricum TaxID=472368 RepID=A0A2Z7AP61_9LAMI|nr:hypothetical protein F511_12094 [Dorcoceras hygrometricum]